MILASTAGWKLHIVPEKDPEATSVCGLRPGWGWSFVEHRELMDQVKEGAVCENCLHHA